MLVAYFRRCRLYALNGCKNVFVLHGGAFCNLHFQLHALRMLQTHGPTGWISAVGAVSVRTIRRM